MTSTTVRFILLQSLTDDVNRQMEREKGLQKKYADLQLQIKELQEQYKHIQDEYAASQTVSTITGSEEVSSTTNGEISIETETTTSNGGE